ncbi:hypothetical protein CK203_041770 [Vitis vinifera]|uniref:NAD(P)-binding domain-containing protein n=1 Tax=Vitis vinifera TaxID=29760 RepID=A0A438HH49_VITVI|nr:hypothetical protein CK203_041770 [Vitis vinifera]
METSGIVLVAGATGGVGRRVVDILRKKGLPVRVLVRNEEKARKMLGPDIDLIVGDITKESTLVPEYFKGVRKVINAVSVIVGPKEGDTPDRAKYSQIKGDSPEMVEYIGMKNLINAVKEGVGLRTGKLIYGFEGGLSRELPWGALDDVVMGGVSESTFQVDPTGGENGGPTGVFKGVVSTANNGGFTSIRTRGRDSYNKGIGFPQQLQHFMQSMNCLSFHTLQTSESKYSLVIVFGINHQPEEWITLYAILAVPGIATFVLFSLDDNPLLFVFQNFSVPEDVSAYDGLELRLKGDGRRYKLIVRTSNDWDTVGYTASFDTVDSQWQSLMFSKFEYDGKLNPTFAEGAFQLPVSSIRAYIKDPITPRFVHVSSAGVTRPERPGLDLSKQPPAVRLNKELGFILTFKLKGEDLIRESGVPYAIVRPCALTEEPAGADLIFDQGDNITGKVSREEIARICIAALESPYACDKTFERAVYSGPRKSSPEKDYNLYFKTLKDGITGKEMLEQRTFLYRTTEFKETTSFGRSLAKYRRSWVFRRKSAGHLGEERRSVDRESWGSDMNSCIGAKVQANRGAQLRSLRHTLSAPPCICPSSWAISFLPFPSSVLEELHLLGVSVTNVKSKRWNQILLGRNYSKRFLKSRAATISSLECADACKSSRYRAKSAGPHADESACYSPVAGAAMGPLR